MEKTNIKGIDISSYQRGMPASVINSLDFAILKISEGQSFTDPAFDDFYNIARIPLGAYVFSHAVSVDSAVKEATRAIQLLNGRKLPLGIYMDIETPEQLSLSKNMLTSIARAFCDTVRSAGYQPGIYGSELGAWWILEPAGLGNVVAWVANWSTKPSMECDIWQYSSNGSLSGYNGPVDLDLGLSERMIELINGKSKSDIPEDPVVYPETCSVSGKLPVLKNGSYDQTPERIGGLAGNYVELLQERLIKKNYTCGGYGSDGIFGNGTEQSVRNFQEEKNLPITGVVDEKFWEKLLFI